MIALLALLLAAVALVVALRARRSLRRFRRCDNSHCLAMIDRRIGELSPAKSREETNPSGKPKTVLAGNNTVPLDRFQMSEARQLAKSARKLDAGKYPKLGQFWNRSA